ncbi:hypothetical protein GVAV_001489 [Gurleya vavrai]
MFDNFDKQKKIKTCSHCFLIIHNCDIYDNFPFQSSSNRINSFTKAKTCKKEFIENKQQNSRFCSCYIENSTFLDYVSTKIHSDSNNGSHNIAINFINEKKVKNGLNNQKTIGNIYKNEYISLKINNMNSKMNDEKSKLNQELSDKENEDKHFILNSIVNEEIYKENTDETYKAKKIVKSNIGEVIEKNEILDCFFNKNKEIDVSYFDDEKNIFQEINDSKMIKKSQYGIFAPKIIKKKGKFNYNFEA